MTGRLFGVGVGPGDAELVTVKAARLISAADVVAYHNARHGRSVARAIAEPYLREGQIEEALTYPVTVESTDHPDGYRGAIDEFYDAAAARLATHLDTGRDVVLLAVGDPFFYGSYLHMHKRLAHRYPTEVIPGVTSVSAAAAALGCPLAEGDEVFTVLPGTLPREELTRRLAGTDAAAVLKLGRRFPAVREAFEQAGRLDDGWYAERVTSDHERVESLAHVDPDSVPYFSLALLPSPQGASQLDPPAEASPTHGGEVVVVGLGPAGRHWLTPEAQDALARADDLVGYTTYLDRVSVNPRQRRHASDNRVERERATFALDLARRGRRVAVVSSGDPGVFAMAAAVLEVAVEPEFHAVPVRVLPGLTAANAVASRVGAPLGHDYCVLSLSDRLKPWEIIEQRLAAAAEADFAIAIYNPGSRSRTWQVAAARDLLLKHRGPDTPVVIGRDVGGQEESVRVVRLTDLEPSDVDMRCLLLVGSSMTRVEDREGSRVVFTPRTYPADPQSRGVQGMSGTSAAKLT
jgi:precorrin-2 C20-methyltransferase / precorrin-3B C17-methyltransferase